MNALNQLLSDLNSKAPTIRAAFVDLFDPSLDTFPIPFFGDIVRAKVATVGLNPSDGEIRERGWPRPLDVQILHKRLTQYFNNSEFPPHRWFTRWEQALQEIGVSYSNGTAVHIDLCPWATRPMESVEDKARFEGLVKQSLQSFWRCVGLAKNLQLVLMAGAVTKTYYLNEFLAKMSHSTDMSLLGKVQRNGRAFVGYQQLRIANREYPVFFCSVSPSSRTARMLPYRVREQRAHLRSFLR